MVLDKVSGFVRDAIAPTFCVQCGEAGGWLCSVCAEQILFVKEQVCFRCGKLSAEGKTCPRCQPYTDLGGVMVATHYESGPVKEMIHKFKYEKMTDLVHLLGGILVAGTGQKIWQGWVVVPVPLHSSRLAQRGFNQAELLGCRLAQRLGVVCRGNLLKRVRSTNTQIELARQSRQANMYKAFAGKDMRGLKVLLVDDVMTTGATLEDCARACRDAGARRVWATVVARG